MGAFNTVRGETRCPSCGVRGEFEVQFKYGDTWQLEYRIGDELKWGGNDKGTRNAKKVAIEGIGGPCPNCGKDMLEFDVILENNVLMELIPIGEERRDASDAGYRVIE